jgi:hypothetical protein
MRWCELAYFVINLCLIQMLAICLVLHCRWIIKASDLEIPNLLYFYSSTPSTLASNLALLSAHPYTQHLMID